MRLHGRRSRSDDHPGQYARWMRSTAPGRGTGHADADDDQRARLKPLRTLGKARTCVNTEGTRA